MPSPIFACSILAGAWFPGQGVRPSADVPAMIALGTLTRHETAKTPLPEPEVRDQQSQIQLGPITTRNGRVLCLPFLRFLPRAGLLPQGQSSLETSIQVINDVRRDPKDVGQTSILEEDQETQRLAFLYSRGLRNEVEASIEVPLLARDGGFMDPIISWWHATVLPPQDRVRNHLPFGRSFVRVPGVGDFGSESGVGDVSLFARKRLGGRLIAAAGVKLPTGNAGGLLGSGAFDAGINLEYSTAVGRQLRIDASVGMVAQGKPTVLKHARGLVDQEFLGLTYLQNSRDAWVAQWQSEASPVLTVSSANGAHRMLTFGYERKLSSSERLDLYFSEDHDLVPGAPLLVNIAPDFTIGIRFVKRL